MTKKKVLLFLVEGQSESAAFERLIAKYVGNDLLVRFDIYGGDVLIKFCKTETTKCSVGNAIQRYMEQYSLAKKDIIKVIHLIDTDGCFVPENCIVYNSACKNKCIYYCDKIETDNIGKNVNRNNKKASAIRTMLTLQKSVVLSNIPYEIYYFSCNLNHVLYNEPNLDDSLKVSNAYDFCEYYSGDIQGFIDFLKGVCPPCAIDSKFAWDYVQQDFHSLEKNSNFYFFFNNRL